MYSYIYRFIQNLISFFLLKKSFKESLQIFLNKNNFDEIHDIGCSDGILASKLDLKNTKYFGYDIDLININRAKEKFKNKKNIKFFNRSIDQINIKNKNKIKIFLSFWCFSSLK